MFKSLANALPSNVKTRKANNDPVSVVMDFTTPPSHQETPDIAENGVETPDKLYNFTNCTTLLLAIVID